MSDAADETGLLWRRLTAALASRGASVEAAATARETARHADAKLGTDFVGRFVEGYYLPQRYGGTPSLTEADAEALVAAVEALPVADAKTEATPTATASREAMAVGLEDLRAEEEARRQAEAENKRAAKEKARKEAAERQAAQAAQERAAAEATETPAEEIRRKVAEAERAAEAAQRKAIEARAKALDAQHQARAEGDDAVRDGHDAYTLESGDRYEGEVRDGMMNGYGVYIWPDGERYEGEWRDDNRNGHGVYSWPSGTRYEGEWRDDNRNGYGVYSWPDGERYAGAYRDDNRNGDGVCTRADGERVEGEWRDGQLLESSSGQGTAGTGNDATAQQTQHSGGRRKDKKRPLMSRLLGILFTVCAYVSMTQIFLSILDRLWSINDLIFSYINPFSIDYAYGIFAYSFKLLVGFFILVIPARFIFSLIEFFCDPPNIPGPLILTVLNVAITWMFLKTELMQTLTVIQSVTSWIVQHASIWISPL